MVVVVIVCAPFAYWQWMRQELPPERAEQRQRGHERRKQFAKSAGKTGTIWTAKKAVDYDGTRRARRYAKEEAQRRADVTRQQTERNREWDKLRQTWADGAKARNRRRGGFFS